MTPERYAKQIISEFHMLLMKNENLSMVECMSLLEPILIDAFRKAIEEGSTGIHFGSNNSAGSVSINVSGNVSGGKRKNEL